MAKIADGTFRDWQDTEVIHASEYKQEREILKTAINDNDERLSDIETVTDALQLGTVQLQKITDDVGAPKVRLFATSDDLLAELVKLGRGMHTFYAASGSKNLPPTNISIRGISHFTDPNIGWVYATDYRNNIFTNYYDSGGWKGWKLLNGTSYANTVSGSINNITISGNYFVNAGTANLPVGSNGIGTLVVVNADSLNAYYHQEFIDLFNNTKYMRSKFSGTWSAWKKLT